MRDLGRLLLRMSIVLGVLSVMFLSITLTISSGAIGPTIACAIAMIYCAVLSYMAYRDDRK